MNKLISIFIPTYNRCDVLDRVLDEVISSIRVYEISVYIYDNCSTDLTEDLVRRKKEIYPYINYTRNPTNIGLDNNMLNVFKEQKTKYTLMLGDDDFIENDFYPRIEYFLEQSFDFIVLSTNPKLETTIFSEKLDAFSFLWDKMPYGTLIMRNGIVCRKKIEKYIGTSHAYSAISWESLISSGTCGQSLFYSNSILVRLGTVEKTWKSNAIDILMYQIPLWFSLLPEAYVVKNEICREYMKDLFSLRNLCFLWRKFDFRTLKNVRFLTRFQKMKYRIINKIQ